MRTTTSLGLLLGLAFVCQAVWSGSGDASLLAHRGPLLLVLGGTLAAAILASSRRTAHHALSAVARLLVTPGLTTRQVSEALVDLARRARAQGLASLDPETVSLDDPFLLAGVRLVVDGVEPERLEELLRLEAGAFSERRVEAERLFRLMAQVALRLGVAGTLLALMQLPPGTSLPALTASFAPAVVGLLLAGLLFLPLAGKVRTLDRFEQLVRDQVVTGLLAVRLGQNPDYVRDSLAAFIRRNG